MPVCETAPPLPLPLLLGFVAHEQPGDREIEGVRRRLREGAFYDARAQMNVTESGRPWIRAFNTPNQFPSQTYDRFAGGASDSD